MAAKGSNVLLEEITDQAMLDANSIKGQNASKCVIKLTGITITDIQEAQAGVFNLDRKKLIGAPIEQLFPELQDDGKESKFMIQSLMDQLQVGQPLTTSLLIKTKGNNVQFAEADIFSFEKDQSFITLSPSEIKATQDPIDVAGHETVNVQNLISEGSLMFKCYDVDSSVYYLNSAYLDYTATSFNQQLKAGWIASVNIGDRDRVKKVVLSALKNHEKYTIHYRLEKADNTFASVYESGIPVFNKNGTFNGIAAAIIDLSEMDVSKSPLSFRTPEEINKLSESAPVLFKMSNSKNEFYYFSNHWLKFTGKPLKEQRNEGWLNGIYPEDHEVVKSTIEAAQSKRKKYAVVYRINNKSNQLRWVHEAGIPLYETEGEFSGYITASIDITERKIEEDERNLQNALQESERKLHASLEKSHLITLSLDREGKITFCNDALTKVTGKLKEDLVGNPFYECLFDESIQDDAKDFLNNIVHNSGYVSTFEGQVINKKGNSVILKLSSVVLYNAKGQNCRSHPGRRKYYRKKKN